MGAARQELSGLKHESNKRKEILGVRSFYSAVAKTSLRQCSVEGCDMSKSC